MPKFLTKITFIFSTLLMLTTLNLPLIFAQVESVDLVSVYTVADKDAVDGDIISSSADKGLQRSSYPYDLRAFGVISKNPLMVYKSVDNQGQPVIRAGTALVNVTTINGPIKVGDYITTSDIPGKGQKATASGYVIGIALTSLDQNEGEKIRSGKITVAMKIEYTELTTARTALRLLNSINTALFTNISNPDQFVKIFRYITATVVVLISFAVGFLTFSKSIPKGIEAIGRNPLAQKTIMFSIVMNIFFTIITTLAGIGAAIIILRF